MVYEVSPEGEVLHLKDIGRPKNPEPEQVPAPVKEAESTTTTTTTPADNEAGEEDARRAEEATVDASSLPAELQDLSSRRPHWRQPATTAALLPILPPASIRQLYALVVEGRKLPKPKPEAVSQQPATSSSSSSVTPATENQAAPPGSDNGWAELAARRREAQARRAQEEEESMNQVGDSAAAGAAADDGDDAMRGQSSFGDSRGGRGGRGQGRDRGRGRGHGGNGDVGGAGGRPEKQVDEREVLSEVSLRRLSFASGWSKAASFASDCANPTASIHTKRGKPF